jgi:hypothetical protein
MKQIVYRYYTVFPYKIKLFIDYLRNMLDIIKCPG